MKYRKQTQHIRRYRSGRRTAVNRGIRYKEILISPKKIYENPIKFSGVLAIGKQHPNYPITVFNFLTTMHPDFPERFGMAMKGEIYINKDNKPYILFGEKEIRSVEIPIEIYDKIKDFI